MKKFFEIIKDILYDSIDYIIMIGIIGIVVFIIGWRLDLLFAKDALDLPPTNDIIVENDNNQETDSTSNNQDNEQVPEKPEEDTLNEDSDDIVENTPPESNESVSAPVSNNTVKITIPAGSLPSRIGSILESNGLVSSKGEFVQKSQELKLDTKLKSGEYEIESGSSLEDIIKLIAGKK